LTEADLEQIYETYLSHIKTTDRIDKVGARVISEIDEVMTPLTDALGMSASYDASLDDASQKLGAAKSREQVKAIVEVLVKSTHEMRETNKALEDRLTLYKNEISNLQQNLEAIRAGAAAGPIRRALSFGQNGKYLLQQSTPVVMDPGSRSPCSLGRDDTCCCFLFGRDLLFSYNFFLGPLARLRALLQRRALGGRERRPRPCAKVFGIVEQARRQLPVGIHRDRPAAGLIRKRLRPFRLELRNGLIIGAKIEAAAERERKVGGVGRNAEARKHPADRDGAKVRKQVDQEIAVHAQCRSRLHESSRP